MNQITLRVKGYATSVRTEGGSKKKLLPIEAICERNSPRVAPISRADDHARTQLPEDIICENFFSSGLTISRVGIYAFCCLVPAVSVSMPNVWQHNHYIHEK